MARLRLTDNDWALIGDVFPPPAATGRPRCDPRQVLDGILWVLRTGSPWRDLPEEFGTWKTAWRMFDQWNGDGTLDTILHRTGDPVEGRSKENEDRAARSVAFDKEAYRRRNIVERLIGWLKESRRIFSRFEKTAKNFGGMIKLAFIRQYLTYKLV